MIEINLLPSRPRPVWSALLLPVILLLAGALLVAYLVVGYIELRQSVSTMRTSIQTTEHRQAELQLEIQQLSKMHGVGGEAKDLLKSLRELRPDLELVIREMEAPLPEGGQMESLQFDAGSVEWTCSFHSMNAVGAYSTSIQQIFAEGEVFIQSVNEQDERYIGTFRLLGRDIPTILGQMQAGEAG
ncbi:hypothetical protein [Paenibacillus lutimineralis]|uniref:PilN domain-containing protein n=1 Tax=Paenibacillus lutimineralis TaxID=2707005 RepID=A0A3Q9I8H1_9BACL|nr:hypothetical protein [Paenibacillus lutimineralis]AZS13516.1 hypothetical protein EI981_02845 [Paenibacillus lutimineralis]